MTGRSRVITWEDPVPTAKAAKTMNGLDFIRAMAERKIPFPPMADLMGLEISSVEEGRVVFEVEPGEHHYNPIGSVHGGLACTVSDSAMGRAVHTMLPRGAGYTTLEIKVNFLRPITADTGKVLCEGKAVHIGRRAATAEARLFDESGKLHGHATTTCMVFREGTDAGRVGEGG